MKRLEELRKERNLSQNNLAQRLFTSQQAIDSYEKDRYQPDIEMLKRMATYFETSVDYLVGLVDTRTPIPKLLAASLDESEALILANYRGLSPEVRRDFNSLLAHLMEEREQQTEHGRTETGD